MKPRSVLSLALVGLMLAGVSLEIPCAFGGQAQREAPIGDLTGRDAVGFRKDKVTTASVGERSIMRSPDTKQTMQDFREIQELNIKLRKASKETSPALEDVIETATKMNTIALRLKNDLILPKPKEKIDVTPAASIEALVTQIGDTDANVKLFVTNPLFRQGTDTVRNLPLEASTNLAKIIALTKAVREGASKVRSSSEKEK